MIRTKISSGAAQPAPPATLFLFGAHGDLVPRLLMPALYNLARAGSLHSDVQIVGVDHNPSTDRQFRDLLGDALRALAQAAPAPHSGRAGFDAGAWRRFAARISYQQGDFLDDATYRAIAAKIAAAPTGNALFYLATAPRFFGEIGERLGRAKLLQETRQRFRRLVVEKPFGNDLASARALNTRLLSCMDETQIYRIDHFLGKETVQNILVSRFANSVFESFWNNHYIDHVQITAAETVGVEARGSFYEATGALRDMVPNHLFQLLAMVAMEAPNSFDADSVRSEKAKVIGAIRPQTRQEALANSVRGQYRAGTIAGRKVVGYRREARVDQHSHTETYAALKVTIDNWRWAGVPFYLRTGKRLSARDTKIAICFKPMPFSLFRDTDVAARAPSFLVLQIQPDEGLWFDFQAKRPGPKLEVERVEMGFAYADFFEMQASTGYETLVYDCLIGDQTLFQRADNIEVGWHAVQPFLDAWADSGEIAQYAAGSAGPKAAQALLAADGRSWHSMGI